MLRSTKQIMLIPWLRLPEIRFHASGSAPPMTLSDAKQERSIPMSLPNTACPVTSVPMQLPAIWLADPCRFVKDDPSAAKPVYRQAAHRRASGADS